MIRNENAKQNDTFILVNGKWIFDNDWVDGFKIHKCLNSYLVYVQMLRHPDNSKNYGQQYEITVSFPTLDGLFDFMRLVFSDQDAGSTMVTQKFKNFVHDTIPKYHPGGEKS